MLQAPQRAARPLPADNRGKTHCHRGHLLAGDNLQLRSNGARICVACRLAWHRAHRVKRSGRVNKTAQADRKAGLLRYGYRASVLQSTGQDRLEAAFAAIREQGMVKAADAVLTPWRRRAIVFFHPDIGARMRALATAGRPRIINCGPVRSSSLANRQFVRRPDPTANLLEQVRAAIPLHLARDHRDDVISELTLAVLEGRVRIEDIEKHVRKFISASYRDDHNKFGPLSLDMPAFREGATPLIETISRGLWQ